MIGRRRALRQRLQLPGRPKSAAAARALVRVIAASDRQAENAALVVSEFIANSVEHSRSGLPGGIVVLIIESAPDRSLRICVRDAGPIRGREHAPAPDGIPESGFGLPLVAAVSASCNVAGRRPWAEVAA